MLSNIGDVLQILGLDQVAYKYQLDSYNMIARVYLKLATKYYNDEDIILAIKYQEMLNDFLPNNRVIQHNLACMYHIKALEEKEQNHELGYEEYLSKAWVTFESTVKANLEDIPRASTYVEYTQFLLKHHDKNNEEEYLKIVKLLSEATSLEDGSGLDYNQLEKPTVCEPLQELLNKQEKISVRPNILAYYLLTKIHITHGNYAKAQETLNEFKYMTMSLHGTEDGKLTQHLYAYIHKEELSQDFLQTMYAATVIQHSWQKYIQDRRQKSQEPERIV